MKNVLEKSLKIFKLKARAKILLRKIDKKCLKKKDIKEYFE